MVTMVPRLVMFQFTHPGGVRLSDELLFVPELKFQFTHPGGVRLYSLYSCCLRYRFNSRTREGCDEKCSLVHLHGGFQFTHPGGVRP